MRFVLLALGVVPLAGCPTLNNVPDCSVTPAFSAVDELSVRARVIYVEGAGGDLQPQQFQGVTEGMRAACVKGEVIDFLWNTGEGLLVDHTTSQEFKRARAGELAELIERLVSEDPLAPIDLVAFSSGAVIAVYALEMLPAAHVRGVALISGSISDSYDLGPAISNTTGRWIVLSLPTDNALLTSAAIGTADGRFCGCAIGLEGPKLPVSAGVETRLQYARICNLEWRSEFALLGHFGAHTDPLKPAFISIEVAPRLRMAP